MSNGLAPLCSGLLELQVLCSGPSLQKHSIGQRLLLLFRVLMVVVGLAMFRRREGLGDPKVRLTADTTRELLPLLLGTGFGVGFLSGFFGIGGGFLIVQA
jgi:uncharacterized protein